MIGALILGLVAGLIGRLLMPGKDNMGIFGTVGLGLAGAVVGWLVFTYLLGIGNTAIFDWGGLLSAVIGVLILLTGARLIQATTHSHRLHRPHF
jgi:uncharacterized membrane protein YeaQ/YmgE (transglycosylase-associated protein family)